MLKEYSVHTVTYIHSTWCGGVVVTSCEIYISKLYNLIMRLCAAAVWCCIQYWCVQSLTANPELSLCPIYTIQPVVKLVWQPVECSYTRYSWLSNRFDNRFNNRLYTRYSCLWNWLTNGFHSQLNVCIQDTTGCQTGLTTGCIVYTNIYPVVKPFGNRFDNMLYRVNGALRLWFHELFTIHFPAVISRMQVSWWHNTCSRML